MTTVKATRAPHPPTKLPNLNNGLAHITSWPFAPDGYIPNSVIRSWRPSQQQPQPQPPISKRKPVSFIGETHRKSDDKNGWLPIIGVPENNRLHQNTTMKRIDDKSGSLKNVLKDVPQSNQISTNASSKDSNKNECLEKLPATVPYSQLKTVSPKNSSSLRGLRKRNTHKGAVPQSQQICANNASSITNPNKMEESRKESLAKLTKIVLQSQNKKDSVKKDSIKKVSSIILSKKMEEDKKVVPQSLLLRRKNASSIGEKKTEENKNGSSPVMGTPHLQNVSLPKIPGKNSRTPKIPKPVPQSQIFMSPFNGGRNPISPPIYLYRRARAESAVQRMLDTQPHTAIVV